MAQGQTTLNVIIVTQGIDGTPSYTPATIIVLSSASAPPRPTPGPTPPGGDLRPEHPIFYPPGTGPGYPGWSPNPDQPHPEFPIAGPPWFPEQPGGPGGGGGGGGGGEVPPVLKPPTETTPGLAVVRNAPADTPPPTDTSTWTLSQVAYGPGKIANALIGPYIEHHQA